MTTDPGAYDLTPADLALEREDVADERARDAQIEARIEHADYLRRGEYEMARAARHAIDATLAALHGPQQNHPPEHGGIGTTEWVINDYLPRLRPIIAAAHELDDACTPERQDECLMRLRDAVQRARGTWLRPTEAVTW